MSSLSWGDLALDDGSADIDYSATSESEISLGGYESGKGVAAVDENGDLVDSGFADDDGYVNLTVPSGSHTLTLEATPSQLQIHPESRPSELIDTDNMTIEFFVEDELDSVVTRNASGGKVNMSGLPADESFVAVASADGYSNRRIFIDSLIQTQDIYLPGETEDTVAIEFNLEDFSGNFNQESTVLEIQRSIDGNWQTVEGDFFGATSKVFVDAVQRRAAPSESD